MIIAGKSQSTQRTGLPWLVDQQFPHHLQILLLIENRIDRNNQASNRPTPQHARPRLYGELVFTVFKQILFDYHSVSINDPIFRYVTCSKVLEFHTAITGFGRLR